MNLIQIKYFLEVAECLNFTAAAARLFVSQQCVSKQVAKLEREIGVRLFERSTAKVALTDAGKLLQGEWSAMLERCDQAVVRARAVPGRGAALHPHRPFGAVRRGGLCAAPAERL